MPGGRHLKLMVLNIDLSCRPPSLVGDFDFLGRFTPTKGFAFGVDNGKPLTNVQYKFERLGKTSIACRVQDDLGGEKIYTEIISVK